ncbi:hypothetical protein HZY97_06420 [Sphingomonas sp. R-74633]|uniref:hypothetical protein n=1 Tax=Sphingomonas sp. R-74633 TaxID=2751188 RepID=UPI0015D3A3D9|nr:hypothetical protein [Sphingomonas sp. R-74633]NYT40382.1 hypothetical protein [Sphingomonas sp. R-74633]
MAIFERWFLSRFVPEGDSYLYWVREGAVRFERTEVEALSAERRRIVTNPLLWTGWVALGIALPLWLIRQGNVLEALGIALAVVANVSLVATLTYADDLPGKAAQTRMLEKFEGVARPSFVFFSLWLVMAAFFLWRGFTSLGRDSGPYSGLEYMAFLVIGAIYVGLIVAGIYRFWREWRCWQAQLSGR